MTARRVLLPVFPNFHGRGEIEELLDDLGTRKLSWRAGSQFRPAVSSAFARNTYAMQSGARWSRHEAPI